MCLLDNINYYRFHILLSINLLIPSCYKLKYENASFPFVPAFLGSIYCHILYTVMYAIWHIRPHSLFAGPSLSRTLRPPNLSLDGPTCLPAALLRACYTCVTYLRWPKFARMNRIDTSLFTRLIDVIQVTLIDSSLI